MAEAMPIADESLVEGPVIVPKTRSRRKPTIGRVTLKQYRDAKRAAVLIAQISTAKSELAAIDRDIEPLLSDGVTQLYFGKVLVADLKDTSQRRVNLTKLRAEHPRLVKRFTELNPTTKIHYCVAPNPNGDMKVEEK